MSKRTDYLTTDADPNPWFRPTLDALVNKLRDMRIVQPDDAKFRIIDALLWDLRKNGTLLTTIASNAMRTWVHHSDHRRSIYAHEPLVRLEVVETLNHNIGLAVPGIPGYFTWTGTDPMMSPPKEQDLLEILISKSAPSENTTEAVSENRELTAADESAMMQEVLTDEAIKEGTQNIVFEHQLMAARMRCTCKKQFEFAEQWARHVRIQIWRYLKTEFAPEADSSQ